MISSAPPMAASPAPTDAWFTRARLLLLIGAFVVIAFPSVIIGTNSFFYRDMSQFGYPLAHYHREAFWRGEIPFWNPLNNLGLPFLAQWNTLVLYPGSLIYLLLPLPWSMNLFVLAHMFLGAAGMYTLGLRWTENRFAASVAGLAFAWNGLTLHALMWPNNMVALGWMPWVVLAMNRVWTEGGRRVAIAALVGSMQMLSGAPEIILLTWMILGLLCVHGLLKGETSRGPMLFRFILCGSLIAAICAAQLLPFLDLLRHSHRDASFGGASWAMPLWGWANFLVPLFGCTPAIIGVYSQDSQQWTSSYYMGIAVVALALLAFRARDSRVKWLVGVALAGLVMALGDDGFVYAVLKKVIPGLGYIRFPIKYVVLVVFALPLLAAFGVAALQRTSLTTKRPCSPLVIAFSIVFGLTVAVIIFAWLVPQTGLPATSTKSGVTRMILLAFILGALLLLPKQTNPVRQRIVMAGILALMAVDVLTHMPRQNPTVSSFAYDPLRLGLDPLPKLGESRAMLSPPMHHMLQRLGTPDPYAHFTGNRHMLISNCNLIDRVPKVNGFYSLYLREPHEVISRLYASTNYHLPLIDFLGVNQLSHGQQLFAWQPRTSAMPLVTAGQAPVFASASESLDAIFAPTFEPRRVVYLSPEAQSITGNVQTNACRVLSSVMGRERVSADVEAVAVSLVVFSHAYSHLWKASVDGVPAPVLKANHAFQAVIVPAGRHRIELRYVDKPFRAGAVISVIGLFSCAIVGMRPNRKLGTQTGAPLS